MKIGYSAGINATDAKAATILTDIAVPTKNSAANILMRDVAGNKTDDEQGNSLYSLAYIIAKSFNSASKVYPTLAVGVLVSKNAASYVLGTKAEIIPAAFITKAFKILGINFDSVGAADVFEIVIYAGAIGFEVEIGRTQVTLSVSGQYTEIPINTPIIAANARISAAIAGFSAGVKTMAMKLRYVTY